MSARSPKVSARNILLGLLVSGVSLYFVLRGVEWGEVWGHLSEVSLPLFGLSMLLMLAAYFLMTWRWQHLLDPLDVPGPAGTANPGLPMEKGQPAYRGVREHAGLISLYGKMMTGYFFNAFFPARAGDLVRAYLLGRRTGLRKTTILATIVIEKAFDAMALLVMLLVSLILLPATLDQARLGFSPDLLAWGAGVGLAVALVGLIIFYRYSYAIARITERVLEKLPLPDRLRRFPVRIIETFASGMHVFKNPRPLVSAALISALVWLVVALMFLAGLESFTAQFPSEMTSPVGLLFMTALVNLGLLIPALPGNVGTYEALVVAGMYFFRVDKELAVAFALIFHVGQLVVTLLVGVIAFWMQNLSLRDIGPVEEQAEEEAEKSLQQIEREADVAAAAQGMTSER
jgi:glycosyltransferase 2 family protein